MQFEQTVSRTCGTCGKPLQGRQKRRCSNKCGGVAKARAAEGRLNVTAFDNWSPDMAYALGLVYTDGWIKQPAVGSWQVGFCNTDLATVKWWHGFLGNPNHILQQTPKLLGQCKKTCYSSISTSNRLRERLGELGIVPRKSWADLRIPEMPFVCLSHFLRGFMDGDGGVWTARSRHSAGGLNLFVSLASNSATLRSDLSSILMARRLSVSENGIDLRLSGSNAEKFLGWLYAEPGPRMVRKEAVWTDWQAFRAQHGGLVQDFDRSVCRGVQAQEWHYLCGTMPDSNLALQLGLVAYQVYYARKRLGIPAYRSKYAPGEKSWHVSAGLMPDREVARRASVTPSVVCVYRKKMGIPRFPRTQRAA